MIKAIYPVHWTEYELIDSGNGMKLEKFGHQILELGLFFHGLF